MDSFHCSFWPLAIAMPTNLYLSLQRKNLTLMLNCLLVFQNKYNEIPDFIHPFCPCPGLGTLTFSQMNDLSKVFCVLVDTYEELEHDIIDYLSEKPIPARIQQYKEQVISTVTTVILYLFWDCCGPFPRTSE